MLIAAMAVTNVSVAFAAMFAGVAGLASGTAAVLANAQPLLILLPAWWLYGERITARTTIGLVGGFVGLLVVAVPGGGGSGAWLSMAAAAAITTGTLLLRQLRGTDVVQAAGWHFLIGGFVLVAVASAVEGPPGIDWTPRFTAALAFLAVVGTALAFWAWFVETLRCPLGEVAAWTFLTPVFGVLFGLSLTDEWPAGWTSVGLALVLVSLWASAGTLERVHDGSDGHVRESTLVRVVAAEPQSRPVDRSDVPRSGPDDDSDCQTAPV